MLNVLDNEKVISLCLPTNGIIEWVFPVLESIYSQKIDEKYYEVIVTDNGNNEEFYKMMCDYKTKHNNLIYERNSSYLFDNQLEALKLANGKFLKFVNHKGLFLQGTLEKMIKFIIENMDEKPVIYFSNGVMKNNSVKNYRTFDDFVYNLGRWASWTTGVGIWKEDYDKIPKDLKYDKISPHSAILFSEKYKTNYCINDFPFSEEIEKDQSKKGNYDVFKAFGVEELTITLNLYIDGVISAKTFKHVKREYRKFVALIYWTHVMKKDPASYILDGFDDNMGIFFNKYEVLIEAIFTGIKQTIHKIIGR